uniref:Uncharacterized protein n=1 Tax=Promethearchaeum syntrophicum TaxID=2594042 RepID=A0A5B9DGY6_9ARCH|nr:hypothetical protein DSAG12_03848 [Candidatus Prometheoarchaeum syntrophicum]
MPISRRVVGLVDTKQLLFSLENKTSNRNSTIFHLGSEKIKVII